VRRLAAFLLMVALGAVFLPKLHLAPLTLTNAVWAGNLQYQYRILVSADGELADGARGVLHCDFYFDSYPYWEGDPGGESRGSTRQGIEQWCEELPARLTAGLPPHHAFVVLRPNRNGYLSALGVGNATESEARANMIQGDALVEFSGPLLFGRLI